MCVGSAAENSFISARVLQLSTANCGYQSQEGCGWLGLYQTTTTAGAMSNWDTWRSGCTSSFRNWSPGEPNDYGSGGAGTGDENCALLGWQGSDAWFDGPCTSRLRCVCEKPTGDASPPPLPSGQCPSGWTAGAGKCYNRVTTGTPEQCHAACAAAGGELPCVESQAEDTFLAQMSGLTAATCGWTSQADCVWLGLYQSVTTQGASEGWDSWYGGTCTSSYRHWQVGQPADDGYDTTTQTMSSGTGDENCAVLGFGGLTTWFDAPCSMHSACICERADSRIPPTSLSPPMPGSASPPPPSPLPPSTDCDVGWTGGHASPEHKYATSRRPREQAPLALPASSSSSPQLRPRACPLHSSPVVCRCYKKLESPNSAEGCRADCRIDGGEQLCVASRDENEYVADYVLGLEASSCSMTTQVGCAWLGLYQSLTTAGSANSWDSWRGGCESTFRNWNSGEPNDYGLSGAGSGDENCAFFGWSGRSMWSDGPCAMRATCICEKPAGRTSAASSPSSGDDKGMDGGEVFLVIMNVLLILAVGALVYKLMSRDGLSPRARTTPQMVNVAQASTTPYQAPISTTSMTAPLALNDGAANQSSTV